MQIAFLSCCLLAIFAIPVAGQPGDTDPYSVNAVRNALNERTGEQKVIHSWSQKHLSRLGDGVSVALINVLEEGELVDPHTVIAFLPIIPGFLRRTWLYRKGGRQAAQGHARSASLLEPECLRCSSPA